MREQSYPVPGKSSYSGGSYVGTTRRGPADDRPHGDVFLPPLISQRTSALFAPMPDKDAFRSIELHTTVRGGERVLIRPVQPEDMALYPDFLGDVSAEDLRLRFFARIAELSAAEADKLTDLDHRHEMAFVALDEETGQMLGLVRLKEELDEKTAEFAILVRSRLKGHGLGGLLMRRVIDYAKEKGLQRVYGDVLAENTIMLQMCAELGFHAVDMGPDMTRVVLDLKNIGGH